MNISGVLVKPLAEQHDTDDMYIDPAGVTFDPDAYLPLWYEFDYSQPPLGYVKVVGKDDGLWVEGEVFDKQLWFDHISGKVALSFAAGIMVSDTVLNRSGHGEIVDAKLTTVAVTPRHQDPSQPAIEVN